ncbi:MAG: NAD(P) transhydrogenase subunit alpha [Oceanococcaceae bacterium]
MTVKIAVPSETGAHEKRVAMVPAVLPKLSKLGIELNVQQGAGGASRIPDDAYANVSLCPDAGATMNGAQIVLRVAMSSVDEVNALPEGCVLFSFIYANRNPEVVKALQARKITCFAMELVPRTTRAQAMDALSSQAALAGYYGALMGATNLSRLLPMTTFAVGSIRPATVLVMGAGVAGLSAIATARRLGAIVEGYDVRSAVKEQVESLGAKFVDTGVKAEGEGGYARELTDEEKAQAQQVLTKHIQKADVVITTAAIPGRPSPKIVSEEQIQGMKNGAVIIDLAGDGGGNTPLSKPGEQVTVGSVLIDTPINVPSRLAEHASELYAKNLLNFLELIVVEGELKLNFEDDIVAGSCLTHAGEIKHEPTKQALGQ